MTDLFDSLKQKNEHGYSYYHVHNNLNYVAALDTLLHWLWIQIYRVILISTDFFIFPRCGSNESGIRVLLLQNSDFFLSKYQNEWDSSRNQDSLHYVMFSFFFFFVLSSSGLRISVLLWPRQRNPTNNSIWLRSRLVRPKS